MIFFLLALGTYARARSPRDYVVAVVLAIATAASHQLLAALLAALFVAKAMAGLFQEKGKRMRLRGAILPFLLGAFVCAFLLLVVFGGNISALLGKGFKSYLSSDNELFSGEWYKVVDAHLSLYALTYGLVLPVAVIGFFQDDLLATWTVVTGVAALSVIIWPYMCVNFPDRWSYLLSVPLFSYASNAVSRMWGEGGAVSIGAVAGSCLIAFALLVPTISMLNPLGPFSLLDKTYDMFPSRMATSTVVSASVLSDAVNAVRWLSNTVNEGTLFVPDYFVYWSRYYSHLDVMRFSGPADPALRRASASGSEVYALWSGGAESFGLDPLYRSGSLTVYRLRQQA